MEKHREKLKAYHKRKYWERKGQPPLSRNQRNEKYLDELKQIAKSRGGKCLSTNYVNAKTKLEWQCKEDHTWFAVPHHVKDGSWCPKCYNLKRIDRLRNNHKNLTISLQRAKPVSKHSYEPTFSCIQISCRIFHGRESQVRSS